MTSSAEYPLPQEDSEVIWAVADFASRADLAILSRTQAAVKQGDDLGLLAGATMRALLREANDYRRRGCLARDSEGFTSPPPPRMDEVGAAFVVRLAGRPAAAAFAHLTWKGNVFLDWLAVHPHFLGRVRGLGNTMLTHLLVRTQRMGARLFFIESKAGAAARFYRRFFGLKDECDFIVLTRETGDWSPSPAICQLANPSAPRKL